MSPLHPYVSKGCGVKRCLVTAALVLSHVQNSGSISLEKNSKEAIFPKIGIDDPLSTIILLLRDAQSLLALHLLGWLNSMPQKFCDCT